MSDDIKPAMLNEGQSQGQRNNHSEESLPQSGDTGIDAIAPDADSTPLADGFRPSTTPAANDIEGDGGTTPSPDIEVDAEADPQAPNKKGEG